MKKITLTVLLLALVSTVDCTHVGLLLVNTSARFSPQYTLHKDLSYGNELRQNLNVFSLKNQTKLAPVVVFFYGGSWTSGSKDDYRFIGEAFASKGIVTVIPDYRLYPQVKFPEFVNDGAKSLTWVRDNIEEYGGNSKEVYVMGHSAGAHIAAMLSYDNHFLKKQKIKQSFIEGFIGISGPYDFLPFANPLNKKIFAPEKEFKKSQPINYVKRQSPRTLLIHGIHDKTVGIHNSRNLAKKLRANNVPVQTEFLDNLNHVQAIAKFSKLLRGKGKLLTLVTNFVNDN